MLRTKAQYTIFLAIALTFLLTEAFSQNSVQLIPGDERVSRICKAEISVIYCTDREASSAVVKCIVKLPNRGMAGTSACEMLGGDACLKKKSTNLPCGNPTANKCPRTYEAEKQPASDMTLSKLGVKLMRLNEGFKSKLYNDNAGNCTVGIGHFVHLGPCNGGNSESPFRDGISEPEAEKLLASDSKFTNQAIQSLVKTPLSQAQYDVLFSFVFQFGRSTLAKSALLSDVNRGDWETAKKRLSLYNKVRDPRSRKFLVSAGLQNRRARETSILNGDCSVLGDPQ